jgi:hypothetical protein
MHAYTHTHTHTNSNMDDRNRGFCIQYGTWHTCIHTNTCRYTHTTRTMFEYIYITYYIYIYLHVCIHIRMHVYINTYTYTYTYTCCFKPVDFRNIIHVHLCMYVCMYIHKRKGYGIKRYPNKCNRAQGSLMRCDI